MAESEEELTLKKELTPKKDVLFIIGDWNWDVLKLMPIKFFIPFDTKFEFDTKFKYLF